LKWVKHSAWCLKSEDGRFMVSKYKTAEGWVYQAIRLPDTSLLVANTADECKAKCEGVA
jgi:hypothetical protein